MNVKVYHTPYKRLIIFRISLLLFEKNYTPFTPSTVCNHARLAIKWNSDCYENLRTLWDSAKMTFALKPQMLDNRNG
jgi:hypothetical protein